ncbi:MAG: thiamine phosphate synthase [Deltaproteobacteria bacterium]|nr:thiamine phosphate synthase [Deltaproteobacteria bacterium]
MAAEMEGLYTIADNTFRPEISHVELAQAYLKGGAGIVQLRMKRDYGPRTTDYGPVHGPILDIAKKIMKLKSRYNLLFIINDYVAIAQEIGADGVHVGADDMSVAKARSLVGDKMLIGYSAHSLEEAVAAEKAGADYVAFGAIFPTKTKGPGHPVQGFEKLRVVVETLRVPVVAIGGINQKNLSSVLETGVSAITMISALTENCDVIASVSEAIQLLQRDCFGLRPRNDNVFL